MKDITTIQLQIHVLAVSLPRLRNDITSCLHGLNSNYPKPGWVRRSWRRTSFPSEARVGCLQRSENRVRASSINQLRIYPAARQTFVASTFLAPPSWDQKLLYIFFVRTHKQHNASPPVCLSPSVKFLSPSPYTHYEIFNIQNENALNML